MKKITLPFFIFLFAISLVAKSEDVSISSPDYIYPGMSTQQLINLKGQPFYQTEHFSDRPGEQVWLYTKKQTQKSVKENNETDSKTQWPMLHRVTIEKTCEVGDVFVDVKNGLVRGIKPADSNVVYGPCVIDTKDEVLPVTK